MGGAVDETDTHRVVQQQQQQRLAAPYTKPLVLQVKTAEEVETAAAAADCNVLLQQHKMSTAQTVDAKDD